MSHRETLWFEETLITYKMRLSDIRSDLIPAIQQSRQSACSSLFTLSDEKLALPEKRKIR
jgi:hypothetical protein